MDEQSPENELPQLRGEIDAIDHSLLETFSRRARLAQRIGQLKQGVVYRPEREAEVLRRLAGQNPGPLPDAAIRTLFRELMSACLALEQPLRVAFLGPLGTYSEGAARKHFGSAPTFLPEASIDAVFRAVEAGRAEYGVVPVENSTEGAVSRTLDLFLSCALQVCGEVMLPVHHQLMGQREGLAGIRAIYSHPQSLGQCQAWLRANAPGIPTVPVASNAEAARLAAEDPSICAIAGAAAAAQYGLNILASGIEDDPRNTTRFLIIALHDAGPSGQDKSSLVCSALNRPGSMLELVAPFARHGVSMTRLESRPARSGLWEYVFYIDIEGHREDAPVAEALAELREKASFLKVLGSYPAAAL